MKSALVLAGFFAAAVAVNGCSSDDGAAPAATPDGGTDTAVATDAPAGDSATTDTAVVDAPATDTLATDAPAEAGSCVALASPTCNAVAMPAGAPSVTEEIGTVPTVTGGGTIPDGSYVLTKRIKEVGPAKTLKEVNVYAGSCVQTLNQDPGGDNRANGTFSSTGSDGTITVTCPPVGLVLPITYRVDTTGAKAKLFTRSESPKIYNEWIQQ
ncbi:MAG: hypothetical protein ABI175_00730 [Polyangiales bacterium]